ncbi:hypothetical protein CJ178_23500 [Rhodococcus sp. ACPA4]|nr:hypothetical protein CJ178_23500 [Rhodococcus sp. ACPA4]ROZ44596.1 hypothetical protein EEB13_26830 [Rhodococcus sp. WS3]
MFGSAVVAIVIAPRAQARSTGYPFSGSQHFRFSADSQESRAEFFGKRVYIEVVELRRRLDFWNLRRECGVERIA